MKETRRYNSDFAATHKSMELSGRYPASDGEVTSIGSVRAKKTEKISRSMDQLRGAQLVQQQTRHNVIKSRKKGEVLFATVGSLMLAGILAGVAHLALSGVKLSDIPEMLKKLTPVQIAKLGTLTLGTVGAFALAGHNGNKKRAAQAALEGTTHNKALDSLVLQAHKLMAGKQVGPIQKEQNEQSVPSDDDSDKDLSSSSGGETSTLTDEQTAKQVEREAIDSNYSGESDDLSSSSDDGGLGKTTVSTQTEQNEQVSDHNEDSTISDKFIESSQLFESDHKDDDQEFDVDEFLEKLPKQPLSDQIAVGRGSFAEMLLEIETKGTIDAVREIRKKVAGEAAAVARNKTLPPIENLLDALGADLLDGTGNNTQPTNSPVSSDDERK